MPVVNKLGAASVSVEADVSGFGRGLNTKLRTALAGAEKEARRAGRRLGREIMDGIADEMLRRAPQLRRKINTMLRGISVTARVKLDIDVDAGGGTTSQIRGLAARIRGQLEGEVLGSVKSASNGIRGLFGNLIPKSLPQLAVAVSLVSIAGAALAGAFNATGRELLNVVKLSAFLPAGLAAIAATAAAVQIGFLGVGEAISAAFARDPKKLAEALKGLTPSARSFVMELNKSLPVFDRIKSATQEALFKPLRGAVTEIVGSLGSSVAKGLPLVAGAVGAVLDKLGSVLSNPKTAAFLDNLFKATSSIITELSGPVGDLVSSLIAAANTALPSLQKLLGGGVGKVIQNLADWLNKVVEDGRFQGFLDSAERTLGDIWAVVKEVALLFGVLFDDANSDGDSFLKIVADLIKRFREFASSNDGKFALEGIATVAKIAGVILLGLVGTIMVMIAAIGSFVSAVKSAIEWVGRLLGQSAGIATYKGGITRGMRDLPASADGRIVRSPMVSSLGEDGAEVVIPLTRPGRARQLAEQSGLTKMLGGDGGGMTQIFYLGSKQIEAVMVQIADSRITDAVDNAATGIRAA